MGYTFSNVQVRNVNAAGSNLLPSSVVNPPLVANTAIGNRIKVSFNINATPGSNFTNRQIRVNLGTWTAQTPGDPWSFGFESDGFIDGVLKTGLFVGTASPNSLTEKNYSAKFQKISNTVAYCEIEMFMTMDVNSYVGTAGYVNKDRFLKATPLTPELVNTGGSVYQNTKDLGIRALVFNNTVPVSEQVITTAGARVVRVPWNSRWYNSYLNGVVAGVRYMNDVEITTPFQIAALMPPVTKATATGPQGIGQNVDASFSVLTNKLSPTEKNSVVCQFTGLAVPGVSPNPATTAIRVLLLRLDPTTNVPDFFSDLILTDAEIPSLQPAVTQIDGAIWTPSLWNSVAPDVVNLEFVIDGTWLVQGQKYRFVVNIYDNVSDTVTSHISPEMTADFTPAVTPTIDGYIGTYNKVYTGNNLKVVAPHSRFKSRLRIDKTTYDAQLLALGLSSTFDDCFVKAVCTIPAFGGSPALQEFYISGSSPVLTDDFVIVTNDAFELIIEARFRCDEERAAVATGINWILDFSQPTITQGQQLDYQIVFNQDIQFGQFENDNINPLLLSAKFYDFDLYPAQKVEVFDLCGRDYIICEIEKDGALLTGSVNFAATIYPADETGDTSLKAIEEEENWNVGILPQLTTAKLDDVEVAFAGDDFVAFRINLQQLPLNQRFWITGIAYDQTPDYCPIGLVQNIIIQTVYTNLSPIGWVIACDGTNFANEILAHPDYVGGITVVTNRIVDNLGNLVGAPQVPSGYQVQAVRIPIALGSVFYEFAIDASFDPGTGAHTIRHFLRVEIPLPVLNAPPVFYSTNTYTCTDLG